MTNEQIKIAMAEACVWRWVGSGPNKDAHWYRAEDCNFTRTSELPDYCNDLNAMHEAEKTMLFSQRKKFVRELQKVIGRQFAPEAMVWIDACIHATARQRAEAFLRVIGKWKEAAK